MRIRAILFGFLLSVLGCTSHQVPPGPQMSLPHSSPTFERLVGSWFGEGESHGALQRWLVQRRSGGDYEILFRQYRDGKVVVEQTERGVWGTDEKTYTTITTQIEVAHRVSIPDTPEHVYIEKYRIIELTDEAFTYEHTTNGTRYTVRRVRPGFAL